MHPSLDDLLSLQDGGRAAPDLAAHLDSCAECRALSDEVAALRTGLRAMPVLAPPHDGWARVMQHAAPARGLHPATARWRHAAAGLAASLALTAVLLTRGDLAAPQGEVVPAAATVASLVELQQESRRLESMLAGMGGARVVSASAASEIAALEDHIAVLDWQLSAGDERLDAALRQALWAERVALMQDLVLVRAGSRRDASSM